MERARRIVKWTGSWLDIARQRLYLKRKHRFRWNWSWNKNSTRRVSRNRPGVQLALSIPITVNLNDGLFTVVKLRPYQINLALVCTLVGLGLLFFMSYQFGRLITVLETSLIGFDDMLRPIADVVNRIANWL
ncbi:hypothetical protein VTP01DRAFT_528 [Rhizomucor pusillus]|uniref:uncharacterized protein n=1 Tax=Rhizomucor pusillus TaxID=4840 RepID=UPI003744195F